MVSAISPINVNFSRPAFGSVKPVGKQDMTNFSFTENPSEAKSKAKHKKELSPLQQTALVIAGLVGIITAGTLIHYHFVDKKFEKTVKSMIDKPKEFGLEYLKKVRKEWTDAGKMNEDGLICCIPKSKFEELFVGEKSGILKALKKQNLSENVFAMIPIHYEGGLKQITDTTALKFVDTDINTILAVTHQLKNGNIVVLS